MRIVALLGASLGLVACAQEARMPPRVAEVPMYTRSEWTEMNAVCTVPEIPDLRLGGTPGFGHMHAHGHSHGHH